MQLSSNDNQLWRNERLVKVRKTACAILGMTETQLEKLVMALHDYKGQLVVVWKDEDATDTQKLAFSSAWTLSGEDKQHVHHEVGQSGLERWA